MEDDPIPEIRLTTGPALEPLHGLDPCKRRPTMAKAQTKTECRCGAPVHAGDKVRLDNTTVIACWHCEPEVEDDPEEDQEYDVRLKIVSKVFSKPDGTFWIYKVMLDRSKTYKNLPPGADKAFSLLGPVGDFNHGDVVNARGKFSSNPRYGFQLQVTVACHLEIRESELGLVAFLSQLPQVGQIRALEMLRRWGKDETLRVLETGDAAKLQTIDGLTEERAAEIFEKFDALEKFRSLRLFAGTVGLGETVIADIIQEWGEDGEEILRDDPFALRDIDVSFKICDEVHNKLNLDSKTPSRCAAIMSTVMDQVTSEGHVYILESGLFDEAKGNVERVMSRYNMSDEERRIGLDLLAKGRTRKLKNGKTKVYPPRVTIVETPTGRRVYDYDCELAERTVAEELARLQNAQIAKVAVPEKPFKDFEPAPEQVEAIHNACLSPVSILTGSGGSGKTTVLKTALDVLEASGAKLCLCAPTGKAAKRMTDVTGRKAQTIHRTVATGEIVSESVVVVDETSMIPVTLFAQLLRLVRTGARLILVGDVNQLPSIDPGRVLYDLIESQTIPTVKLTKVFRQKSDGMTKRLSEFALAINDGEVPDLTLKGTDVVFIPASDIQEIQAKIVRVVAEQIPQKYGIQPHEIQVIAPQKGEAHHKNEPIGTRALNRVLQEELNPKGGPELFIRDGFTARVGDRVIHRVNNYDLGVVNGDQGVVQSIHPKPIVPAREVTTSERTRLEKERSDCIPCNGTGWITGRVQCSTCKKTYKSEVPSIFMIVQYGDRVVGYTRDELREVELAYALTVHLMQGDQARAVVLPIHKINSFILSRALLYTAVSRPTEYLLIIGEEQAIRKAVANTKGVERRTSLIERIEQARERLEEQEVKKLDTVTPETGKLQRSDLARGLPTVVNKATHTPTEDDVYIGRPSIFGNPFTVEEFGRGEAIRLYEHWFNDKIKTDPKFRKEVLGLYGKNLVCHCAPDLCHGEIIAEWLEYEPYRLLLSGDLE